MKAYFVAGLLIVGGLIAMGAIFLTSESGQRGGIGLDSHARDDSNPRVDPPSMPSPVVGTDAGAPVERSPRSSPTHGATGEAGTSDEDRASVDTDREVPSRVAELLEITHEDAEAFWAEQEAKIAEGREGLLMRAMFGLLWSGGLKESEEERFDRAVGAVAQDMASVTADERKAALVSFAMFQDDVREILRDTESMLGPLPPMDENGVVSFAESERRSRAGIPMWRERDARLAALLPSYQTYLEANLGPPIEGKSYLIPPGWKGEEAGSGQ